MRSRKWIVVLIAMAVVLNTLLGTTAFAAFSQFPDLESNPVGEMGNGVTYVFHQDTGKLVISKTGVGSGVIPDYGDSGSGFQNKEPIKSVIIQDGVTRIGNFTFWGNRTVQSVTVAGSVKEIGSHSFGYCTNLTDIQLYDGLQKIGEQSFLYCEGIESITLPATVQRISSQAFNFCTKLNDVTIKENDTDIMAIGGSAFLGCKNLNEIFLPSKVRDVGLDVFVQCGKVTVAEDNLHFKSIDGVLFDKQVTRLKHYPVGKDGIYTVPQTVQIIESNAFYECTGLQRITFPDRMTQIGWNAFLGCSNLAGKVVIPIGITEIERGIFNGCEEITELVIPDSVVSIRESAFSGCCKLDDVSISDKVTFIHVSAFRGTGGVYVSDDNPNYRSVDGALFDKEVTQLIHVPTTVGDTYEIPQTVINIERYAFFRCQNLKHVSIPDLVTILESYTFYACTGIVQITIPGTVKKINSNAFYGCTQLQYIILCEGILEIAGYAFNDGIQGNIVVPRSVRKINDSTFPWGSNLYILTSEEETSVSSYEHGKIIYHWTPFQITDIEKNAEEQNVAVTVDQINEIEVTKWAYGEHDIKYFEDNGMILTEKNITTNTDMQKITLYSKDIGHNEAVKTVDLVGSISASDITYGQSLADATISGGKIGNVAGIWTWQDDTITPVTGTEQFTAVFTANNPEAYTTQVTAQVSVTTQKAVPEYVVPMGLTEVYNPNLTLADIILPEGWSWNESGTKLTVPGGTYKATYTPTDTDNYEIVSDIDIEVEVTKKTPTIGGENGDIFVPAASDITYGQTLADSGLTASSNDQIAGSWSWKDSSIQPTAGTESFSAIFTPTDTDNYETVESEVRVIIHKAVPEYSAPTGLTEVYHSNLTLADIVLPDGWSWKDETEKLTVPGGIYQASYTPIDTDNYEVVNGINVMVEIEKAVPEYEVPTGLTATYHPDLTLANIIMPERWSWNESGIKLAVPGGIYKATYTPEDVNNYEIVEDVDVEVYVTKATPEIGTDITEPTASDIVYGQSLADSKLIGGVLSTIKDTEDDKYIIHPDRWDDYQTILSSYILPGVWKWEDESIKPNAGMESFPAVFTPIDGSNYQSITVDVAVTTHKAVPDYSVPTGLTKVYHPNLTLADIVLPDGWDWEDEAQGLTVPGGIYKASYTPNDTDNYEVLDGIDVMVKIMKAIPEYKVPLGLTEIYRPHLTLSDIIVPEGWSWNEPETKLTVPGGTYKATYTPTDTDNYEIVSDIDVEVEVTKKKPTIGGENGDIFVPVASDITYGQTLVDSKLTASSDDQIAGSWSWKDSSIQPTAGTESFSAIFTPTDTDNYETVESEVRVIIHKAVPEYSAPTGLTEVYHPDLTLANIIMPEGWSWNESGIKLAVPGGIYKATYTPEDVNNYEIVEDVDVEVYVTKATPEIGTDITEPTASDIVYGQSLADSKLTVSGADAVTGIWIWMDDSIKPEAGVANQKAVFEPEDKNNYESAIIDVQVTVKPGLPIVIPDDSLLPPDNSLPSDLFANATITVQAGVYLSNLSSFNYYAAGWGTSETITGTFILNQSDKLLGSQNDTGKYLYTFVPDDPNYVPVEVKVAVTVIEKDGSAQGSGNSSGSEPGGIYIPIYNQPYIFGYADGTFKPDAPITRAEAVTALMRAKQITELKTNNYFDDCIGHWACGYIGAAVERNIVEGYTDGSFAPNHNITRAELAKMIVQSCNMAEQSIEKDIFADCEGHWANGYITTLFGAGIIDGYVDGTFKPDALITRAEVVKIINKAVSRMAHPVNTFPFADVPTTHWAYDEILKAI